MSVHHPISIYIHLYICKSIQHPSVSNRTLYFFDSAPQIFSRSPAFAEDNAWNSQNAGVIQLFHLWCLRLGPCKTPIETAEERAPVLMASWATARKVHPWKRTGFTLKGHSAPKSRKKIAPKAHQSTSQQDMAELVWPASFTQ